MAFQLSTLPWDPAALARALRDPQAGACATFEGWVRVRNEGQAVTALEYEAYAPLALAEGDAILAEARARFGLLAATCVHRTGHLLPGEPAIWVGATAEHRGPAFDACRYIVDQVKARVPIWKKEHYAGGASEWINSAEPGANFKMPSKTGGA